MGQTRDTTQLLINNAYLWNVNIS